MHVYDFTVGVYFIYLKSNILNFWYRRNLKRIHRKFVH